MDARLAMAVIYDLRDLDSLAEGIAVACAIHLHEGTDGIKGVIERLGEPTSNQNT